MNIEELEKIARAATPGPWEEDFMLVRKRMETYSMLIASVGQIEEDTRYIAIFNPETVLKMIGKLKRYEKALKFYASQDYLSEYNSVLFEDGGFKAKEALDEK